MMNWLSRRRWNFFAFNCVVVGDSGVPRAFLFTATAFHGATTMIIVFNCPHCAAILRMKDQYGGQRGRCPQCQGEITVPAIETDAGMDLMPLEPVAPAPAAASAEPAPPAAAPLFSIESRFRT